MTVAFPGHILDFIFESDKQIFDFIVSQDPPLLNINIICWKKMVHHCHFNVYYSRTGDWRAPGPYFGFHIRERQTDFWFYCLSGPSPTKYNHNLLKKMAQHCHIGNLLLAHGWLTFKIFVYLNNSKKVSDICFSIIFYASEPEKKNFVFLDVWNFNPIEIWWDLDDIKCSNNAIINHRKKKSDMMGWSRGWVTFR